KDPLVVVVDGDREDLLGVLLADDVVVEKALDLLRRREGHLRAALLPLVLLGDDVVAEPNALVADVDGRSCDQLPNLPLRLAAEGAGVIAVLMVPVPAHVCLRRNPASAGTSHPILLLALPDRSTVAASARLFP